MNWNLLFGRSYVPYSGRPAACIVEGKSGRYYAGVRIENISFPLTITEDQAAICICLSEGDQPLKLFLPPDNTNDHSFWVKQFNLSTERLIDINLIPVSVMLLDNSIHLKKELELLISKSITPYSGFNIAAMLKTPEGYIHGVNVEFNSWQHGLCAERVAVAKACASGFMRYDSLHLYAQSGEFVSPCGACRQVLLEHMPHNPVILHNKDGTQSMYYSDQLLPFFMTSDKLRKF